jgi:DNA-binding SARP family transcriptional activator
LAIVVDLAGVVLPSRLDNVSVSFPSMPPLEAGSTRIQLCGLLKADIEGRSVAPSLRGRQGRILLAYLVLNRGKAVSRDDLIASIWPDAPPADPPAALRTQLSRLRAWAQADDPVAKERVRAPAAPQHVGAAVTGEGVGVERAGQLVVRL